MLELLICQMGNIPATWLQDLAERTAMAERVSVEVPEISEEYWHNVWRAEENIRVHCMPPARGGEHLDRRKDKV